MTEWRRRAEKKPGAGLFLPFFWGTIIALALVVIAIAVIAVFRTDNRARAPTDEPPASQEPKPDTSIEIEASTLQKLFDRSASVAAEATTPQIDRQLDYLFAPVYQGISRYADFHYTVMGEYTELVGAALGRAAREIERKLYSGFSERLESAGREIDEKFAREFQRALFEQLQAEIPDVLSDIPLAPVTQLALEDALARAKVTVPVGAVMATVGGTAAIKALSSAIAAKVGVKVAAKAAGKTVVKGSGIAGGAGLGALGGAWAGPAGMAVGGIVGGVATWFAVDAAVVTIDEYFNRDDFEAEIRTMVDEHRRQVREQLISALEQKSGEMRGFTLKELSRE